MKLGKKSTYLLLPIFIIIWILLGYRVYITFFSKNKFKQPLQYEINEEQKISVNERYKPKLNFSDPFLRIPRKTARVESSKKIMPLDEQELPIVKPSIEFLGYIFSEESGVRQAVILYNQELLILSKGDSLEKYVVIDISSHSLSVANESSTWKFSLNP